MNGIRGKITVNGQPIDEYAKEQQEKDFMEHMNRQLFKIHHEIEETEEAFIYKVFDEHLRETGRGSFSKADLYRAVYLLEEERAGRLVYQKEGAEEFACDNDGDCEHCEWTTCPEMEGAE